MYDHLSEAVSHKQVSSLCLLDLYTAFDTLKHSILLPRLSSWIGKTSLSLQSFTSHLSSRTSVSILLHLSPSSPVMGDVRQASVIGPILFNLYNTPLRSLISSFTVSHLPYADDRQLFMSFIHKNISSAISNLQTTVSRISSWMLSNYLTPNPSKTAFLLIDLPR